MEKNLKLIKLSLNYKNTPYKKETIKIKKTTLFCRAANYGLLAY
jgi:hypothetical protein